MMKYMAVAVAVAVSGGGAVAVAVPVAGLTKRFFKQKDFVIKGQLRVVVVLYKGFNRKCDDILR